MNLKIIIFANFFFLAFFATLREEAFLKWPFCEEFTERYADRYFQITTTSKIIVSCSLPFYEWYGTGKPDLEEMKPSKILFLLNVEEGRALGTSVPGGGFQVEGPLFGMIEVVLSEISLDVSKYNVGMIMNEGIEFEAIYFVSKNRQDVNYLYVLTTPDSKMFPRRTLITEGAFLSGFTEELNDMDFSCNVPDDDL